MDNPYLKFDNVSKLFVPDTASVKKDVESEFTSVFGETLSLEEATPQGRLIEMETAARTGVISLLALMLNQVNLNNATGRFLDGLATIFGLQRKAATYTTVVCTVSGVPGTVIPAGSLAKSVAGDEFASQGSITISSTGSSVGVFAAVVPGNVPLAAGTLTNIVSQIIGWESITDSASPVFGSATENDTVFRERIENSKYSGVGLLSDIVSALNNVENVIGVAVYNNPQKTDVQWGGVTVDANSVCVVVNGGSDSDIADALYKTVSAGCGYTAIAGQSTNVPYTNIAGGITFNRPQYSPIEISVSVKRNTYTGSDLTADVQTAIAQWASGYVNGVDGIEIGSTVYPFEIGSAISSELPPIVITDVQICLAGGTLSNAPLAFDVDEIATIAADDITVTEV